MAQLTKSNCRVDKGSGAIIFNGSPELQEIQKLHRKMDALNKKVDFIITLLEGGVRDGRTLEDK